MEKNSNSESFIKNVSLSGANTIVAIVFGMITLPISLNYWKLERYGLWALITTLMTYLSTSNLGLNSTATVLISKNANVNIKINIFRKTTILLFISSMIFLFILLLLHVFVPNWIFILGKVPSELSNEAAQTIFWSGFFFLINISLSNINSLYVGFQRMYIERLFSIISIFIAFLCLVFTILLNGSLLFYAVINGMSLLLINVIKIVYFYLFIYLKDIKGVHINSEISENNDSSFKYIVFSSLNFFILGLSSLVVWNTDYLVISHFLSISDVTPYSITFKIYSILFSVLFLINSSMMPIFGKEFGRENWVWLKDVYKSLDIFMTIVGGLVWIGGMFFMRDIVELFVGSEAYAGYLTVFSLGGYSFLLSRVNLYSNILSSLNKTSKLLYVGIAEATINLVLSIILVRYLGIGGVSLGTFLGSLLTSTWLLQKVIDIETMNMLHIENKIIKRYFLYNILPFLIIAYLTNTYVDNILIRLSLGISFTSMYLYLSFKSLPKFINIKIMDKIKTLNFFSKKL